MLNKVQIAETARDPLLLARSLGLLVILMFLIWSAGRAGFASLLSAYAAQTNQLSAASVAINLSPRDPDAHYIGGAIRDANDDPSGTIEEYTQAVLLRPRDSVLWLSLAHARELNNDMPGAIAAAGYAVQLAPYYAQPHWHLGNLLVRAGRNDEGFGELRLAGESNPTLLPFIIDLAWQLSGENVEALTNAIRPKTPAAYIALAEYLKKRGKGSEAISLLRNAGSAAADYRRRYLDELISAKRFPDAQALWSMAHPMDSNSPGSIFDRGFEQESDLDEPGFGWRAKKSQGVVLSLDDVNPREGKSSLRIEFKGESEPAASVISQLVTVVPHAQYQLHFAARAEEIVSGGLPEVTVLDASSGQPLGQSGVLPLTTNGWRDYAFDFSVSETASTIQIVLQRERCSRSPCPIFGRLWLDNFSLTTNVQSPESKVQSR